MKSRLIAGIAAALLAILGIVLVFAYASGADSRAMARLEPVDVLVTTAKVPEGTPVESMGELVALQSLPRAAVPESAVKSLEGLAGKVTATELAAGEQLLEQRLVDPATLQVPGSVPVPEGQQEVTFSVEPQRIVGGKLVAGDTVGLFVSFEAGALEDDAELQTTQRVFHKVLVTSVQRADAAVPEAEAGAEAAPNPQALPAGTMLVTVAVEDINAAKIIFSAEFGRIWLTKEPETANEEPPTVIRKSDVYP